MLKQYLIGDMSGYSPWFMLNKNYQKNWLDIAIYTSNSHLFYRNFTSLDLTSIVILKADLMSIRSIIAKVPTV